MKDRLVTPGYCFILAANFLLYFGFWLLIPVLPFYLSEIFNAGNSTIGIILSCYTVAALCIRPFSGYFLDSFARKPLYLLAYFIFMTMFAGYIIAGSLVLFILFRIIHGVSFGMVTVGGNTVVIDIMPSSRRGEGLGYYGLSNNIGHGGGADVRLVSARCGHELYYHFLLLAGFLHCRIYLRLIGEDTIQTACQARADFARPFYPAERHSGGYQPASIIHSLRDDHQLRGHVCQRNRH